VGKVGRGARRRRGGWGFLDEVFQRGTMKMPGLAFKKDLKKRGAREGRRALPRDGKGVRCKACREDGAS